MDNLPYTLNTLSKKYNFAGTFLFCAQSTLSDEKAKNQANFECLLRILSVLKLNQKTNTCVEKGLEELGSVGIFKNP